jgi:hypothetical protein
MKTLKYYAAALLLAASAFTFTACDGGDPEPTVTPPPTDKQAQVSFGLVTGGSTQRLIFTSPSNFITGTNGFGTGACTFLTDWSSKPTTKFRQVTGSYAQYDNGTKIRKIFDSDPKDINNSTPVPTQDGDASDCSRTTANADERVSFDPASPPTQTVIAFKDGAGRIGVMLITGATVSGTNNEAGTANITVRVAAATGTDTQEYIRSLTSVGFTATGRADRASFFKATDGVVSSYNTLKN